MSDDDVDDSLEDDCVGYWGTGNNLHGFKHGDSFVKILGRATVGVDERGKVCSGQFYMGVVLKFVKDIFHSLEVKGFDDTVNIEQQLAKNKIRQVDNIGETGIVPCRYERKVLHLLESSHCNNAKHSSDSVSSPYRAASWCYTEELWV